MRDGILDAEAALVANARVWKRLALDERVPTEVWKDWLSLIVDGEMRTATALRGVAAAAAAASCRPRRARPEGARVRRRRGPTARASVRAG